MNAIKIFYFVFGALTLVGGIMGFVKAHSMASLIAGGLSGILLIVAGAMFTNQQQNAAILALVVSLALVGFFGKGLLGSTEGKTEAQVKSSRGRAIPMLVLGSVSVVLSAVVLFRR
jgi:uncharacterized membrane protein (UPF0136 family)